MGACWPTSRLVNLNMQRQSKVRQKCNTNGGKWYVNLQKMQIQNDQVSEPHWPQSVQKMESPNWYFGASDPIKRGSGKTIVEAKVWLFWQLYRMHQFWCDCPTHTMTLSAAWGFLSERTGLGWKLRVVYMKMWGLQTSPSIGRRVLDG